MAEFSGQIRIANGLPAKGEKFQLLRERVGGDPEVIATLETNDSGQFTSSRWTREQRWSPGSNARAPTM
jgi:5-hydroxyisourate hydrolase-like protein (transthyretin family)